MRSILLILLSALCLLIMIACEAPKVVYKDKIVYKDSKDTTSGLSPSKETKWYGSILVIGTSVTEIPDDAYKYNWSNLTKVVIHDSVTSIGLRAFRNNGITSLVIPNSVTSIGSEAFAHNSIQSLVIPNSVISIGSEAFTHNSIQSLIIPDSVTSIGRKAFAYNLVMKSVVIGSKITVIPSQAFYDNNIAAVSIPDSVISIGDSAFSGNNLTSLVIPDSVVSIGKYAFSGSLRSVILGKKVKDIGDGAIGCSHSTMCSITLQKSLYDKIVKAKRIVSIFNPLKITYITLED